MEIGIGITTTSNRIQHYDLCMSQIKNHSPWDGSVTIHTAKDIDTIAKAKNECLNALKDCEHIFLFDDDCFPIKQGWINYFKNSGLTHSLYLTKRHRKFSETTIFDSYRDCGGCFMYIHKKAFERVGYFNTKYKRYGFEHAAYSKRIDPSYFKCLKKTSEYIYSLDYQGESNWGIKHKPSITDFKEMTDSVIHNKKIYEEEINSNQIYYPYENSI